jgi:hypothetical protein
MTSIAAIFLLVLMCAGLTALVLAIRASTGRSDPPPEDEGGGGGSVRRRPLPPRDPSNPSDPPWWPQFERDFAEYVTARRGTPTSA